MLHSKQTRYVLSRYEFCNPKHSVENVPLLSTREICLEWHNSQQSAKSKKKKELRSPYNMKKSGIRNFFSQKHVLTFELQILSFKKVVKLPEQRSW